MIVGDYVATSTTHQSTELAIHHSAEHLGVSVKVEWLSTLEVSPEVLRRAAGIWLTTGSPYKSLDGALTAVRFAREHRVPLLGTCGGFQHVVLEYARNVLGILDAAHAEYDPYSSNLFIAKLACSLAGRTMHLELASGSRVAKLYGAAVAEEEYYCNFGVNPDCIALLRNGGLAVVGSDAEGDMRVVELPTHPYFVATLFVPQSRSTRATPHPLVNGFVEAAKISARIATTS